MSRIAVVGAGTMGRRLAVDFARAGHDVVLHDAVDGVAEQARTWVHDVAAGWARDGRLAESQVEPLLAHVTVAPTLHGCLAGADFLFENVPERLDLKRALYATVRPHIGPSTILVSNTSSLPGSAVADASGCPERFINANFGHLGHAKVEVMGHPGTTDATRARTVEFLASCGFEPLVLRREQFGYSSNRVWRAVKKEVLRQLAAGITTPELIDRAWRLDWEVPIGPCALMDRIGLDVVADIEQAYADHLGDPADGPPDFLRAMVAEGKLGVKSGEGFYRYDGSPAA